MERAISFAHWIKQLRAQAQLLAELAAQEGFDALERRLRRRAVLLVAHRGVRHARDLEIRRDLDRRDGDEPDARVLHLTRERFADDVPHFFGDTIRSVALSHLERARDFLHADELDDVAFLDLVEAVEADAALRALLHFAHVVR